MRYVAALEHDIQHCVPVPSATKRARSYPPPRLLICPQDPQGERICSPVLTHAPGGTILQMFPRAWWCTRGNICSPVLGRAPGGTFLRICIRICSPVLGHAPRIPRVSALVPPCLLTARGNISRIRICSPASAVVPPCLVVHPGEHFYVHVFAFVPPCLVTHPGEQL